MSSMSVKDRAKMFGDLANKNRTDDAHSARKREFGNNVVSSSPFLANCSPRSNASAPLPPYSSMSPRSVPFSPLSVNSPKSAVSVPFQQRKDRPTSYGQSPRVVVSPVYGAYSPKTRSPASRNGGMDWPIEESIPAPSSSVEKKNSIPLPEKKINSNLEYLSKPIILPPSPLKSLQNASEQKNFRSPQNTKSPVVEKFANIFEHKEQQQQMKSHQTVVRVESRQPDNSTGFMIKETVQTINIAEKRSGISAASSEDMSQDRSTTSDGENKAPGGKKQMTNRMQRLMRAKRATSPAPSSLTHSLNAARTVMEEEKSSAGSSDASSRSSLSNKELSHIASRALKLAKSSKGESTVNEETKAGSVRGTRTISKVSHQEARLALLSAARKKNKKATTDASGNKNLEISASDSNDSSRGRRRDHPAFAGRASPKPKAKVSSVDIMTSFRQFNSLRTSTGELDLVYIFCISIYLILFFYNINS